MSINRRVTLKMIAEKAGTSIGTVDRAINNRGGISDESKNLVLSIAKELGYRPNEFASALSRKKVIRIGIAYPEEPREFYYDIDMGIDKAVDDLRDYGVVVDKLRYPLQESESALSCLTKIEAGLYDGLAVNSAGPQVGTRINELISDGTPVITFNTDAPESNRLFYIGNNSRQSGQMGGELLSMLLKDGGNVAVIGNFIRATPFIERFGGFSEYIQLKTKGINIFPCSECRNDPGIAEEIIIDHLTRQPDVHGIFCTGYSSTVGAIEALKKLNRNDIYLVGYDITERTAQSLRERRCSALLYQDPFRQGYAAVRLLVRHILEDWLPENPYLHGDTQIIIQSNVDSCMNSRPTLPYANLEHTGI